MPKIYSNLYEINTRVWLRELSLRYKKPINLSNIPEAEIDKLKDYGFDAANDPGCNSQADDDETDYICQGEQCCDTQDNDDDTYIDRAHVGDAGGKMWKFNAPRLLITLSCRAIRIAILVTRSEWPRVYNMAMRIR